MNKVGVGTAGGRQAAGKVGAELGLRRVVGGRKEGVRRDISMEPLTGREKVGERRWRTGTRGVEGLNGVQPLGGDLSLEGDDEPQ